MAANWNPQMMQALMQAMQQRQQGGSPGQMLPGVPQEPLMRPQQGGGPVAAPGTPAAGGAPGSPGNGNQWAQMLGQLSPTVLAQLRNMWQQRQQGNSPGTWGTPPPAAITPAPVGQPIQGVPSQRPGGGVPLPPSQGQGGETGGSLTPQMIQAILKYAQGMGPLGGRPGVGGLGGGGSQPPAGGNIFNMA